MAEYLVQDTTLRALADEIRRETGKTDPLLGASMTDELRTFSDSLTEEIALQNTALDDLEAELNNLEEGSGGSASNKLPLVLGAQSAENLYDITATDLEGLTEIGHRALFEKRGLRSISLPSTCTIVDNEGFSASYALTSVSMPNVTSVGDYAFNYCSALTSVDMPNMTSIGNYAFSYCSALTSLAIPSTCTSIGDSALRCGSSTNKCTFTFEGTTPPSIQSITFDTNYINKIIVPSGCGEAYKTATNWTTVANYIEEATE